MEQITISKVRESFFFKYVPNIYNFHPKDIARIENNDMFIQRFIDGSIFNNPDAGIKDVIDLMMIILKWRQEYGINDMEAKDFPAVIFNCGIFKQATLPNGDMIFCVCGRKYKKVDELIEKAVLPGICWYFEYGILPNLKEGKKVQIMIDLTGCGLKQADTSIITIGIPLLVNYYPGHFSRIYIYNLPWILEPFVTIGRPFVPARLFNISYIIDKNNMDGIMGSNDCIPDFLGGQLVTYNPQSFEGMTNDIESCGIALRMKKKNVEKIVKVISDAFHIQ